MSPCGGSGPACEQQDRVVTLRPLSPRNREFAFSRCASQARILATIPPAGNLVALRLDPYPGPDRRTSHRRFDGSASFEHSPRLHRVRAYTPWASISKLEEGKLDRPSRLRDGCRGAVGRAGDSSSDSGLLPLPRKARG